jgi:hypothetical protein
VRLERVYRECASESVSSESVPSESVSSESVSSESVPSESVSSRVSPASVSPASVQRDVQAPREGASSERAPRESFLESMSTHLK